MTSPSDSYDYDWLVVGSGFGGSVSALRLAEKGYSVGVLECGRRFADHEFPKSTADLKRYFWNPRLGMKGIFRLTTFKDVSVVSGCGVGGGSLGYACTLYVPPKQFFEDRQWGAMNDWESALAPHYEEAQRMLGVTQNPHEDPADQLLRELGEEMGVGESYKRTPVGIYFGEQAGKTVPDPFFGGEGPDRTGCHLCGRCMVGCVHGAKNTLVKNYLYFAEKLGAKVTPERTVLDIRPIGAADGSEGYEVESVRSGAWLRKERRVQRARGVVVSAGPLGTNRLLQLCRLGGSLPRISSRLGELVRTNSESILTVTVPEDYHENLIKRVAISSSIYPDPNTHIETVTYGDGRRLDADALHPADRGRHPCDPAAEAAGPDPAPSRPAGEGALRQAVVAPDDHPAGHADARQRDRPAPSQRPLRNVLAADRTGPRAAQPDLHPGRQRSRRMVRQEDRWYRPELPPPRRSSTSPRPLTSSAAP